MRRAIGVSALAVAVTWSLPSCSTSQAQPLPNWPIAAAENWSAKRS
jgi:hypothetical protein